MVEIGSGLRRSFESSRLRNLAEGLVDLRDHVRMMEASCRANNDAVGRVVLRKELMDLFASEGLDTLGGAANRKPKGVIPPADAVEKIVNIIIGCIFHHLDLLKDDHPLLFHVARYHEGMEEDIGQEVNGQGQIPINHLGIKTGIFPSGKRVERSSDRIDLLGDLKGRPSFRSFKQEMLDEMGNPVVLRLFVPRSADRPHANRNGFEIRNLFRDDLDPISKDRLLIF